jgi:hypothetical protein
MIPKEVLEECRVKARHQSIGKKPTNWTAAMVFVLIRFFAIYVILKLLWWRGGGTHWGTMGKRL